MLNKVIRIKKYLSERNEKISYKVCVGFDGYVDTIVRPVMSCSAEGTYEYFPTIGAFGTYLQGKAGKGCCIELDKAVEKSGGNAYLFANALAGMAVDTTCIGAFGYPQVHPVFQDADSRLALTSVAEAGYCSALEFLDGKIMLGESAGINQMDFQLLKERIGEDKLLQLVEDSQVLSFMNWSELRGSNAIWQGFLTEIFPRMKWKADTDRKPGAFTQRESAGRKQMFLDISDCSGRDRGEVFRMLQMIQEISEYFDVILSLNANEFQGTSDVLEEFTVGESGRCSSGELAAGEDGQGSNGGSVSKEDCQGSNKEWSARARHLYDFCGLKYLCIHLRDSAYGLDGKKEYCVKNRLVQKPKVSTGGGDNFNAGFLYGLLQGLDVEGAMVTGNAASGYYVTRGHSASREGLLQYLEEWEQAICTSVQESVKF